ncbi:GntR family transcriptional regulator [Cupriavidus sp. WKF15]|uniref:GntR family transcriptional regulator n=1 Tax=Cupriavidus sp. WKF15 TaxID=3032282 RepID=UPI0023E0FF1D|nr:GntR family transcriptional regulator [Cupriavidus sp. WKF15]WER48498.1 GntR family transcriptional regulator [Cupriavidus sp. WKF15]
MMMDSSPRSPMPRYHQIYVALRHQIVSGLYDRCGLPPELRLMEQYQVARVTVRRAIIELVREGMVYRRPGQGTFVKLDHPSRAEMEPSIQGPLDSLIASAAQTTVRMLAYGLEPCPADAAAGLSLAEGQKALRVMGLRCHQGKPASLITTYLPAHMAPLLTPHDLDQQQPMLSLLEQGGIRIGDAEQLLSSCAADAVSAPLLEEPVGAALLSVVRVVRDIDGYPVQWLRGLYRPHCHAYRMALTRVGEATAWVWLAGDITASVR